MRLRGLLIAGLMACAACTLQGRATIADVGAPFQPDPPTVYVAKVKNVLVGLPPTDNEVKAVQADPTALARLIDQWMTLPQYQQKMLVFFQLAFQQTQLTPVDFVDMIPPNGLGPGAMSGLLLQNVRESFARTVLQLIANGQPLTDAFTTHQLMMTPALMELYALLDTRRLDDNAKTTDDFAKQNPSLQIYLEAAQGPIPIADSLNPASPNYMHWYSPDVGKLNYPDPSCNVDPIVLPPDAYGLHYLLYGGVLYHSSATKANCGTVSGSGNGVQLLPGDFSDWKLVTVRPPKAGEAITKFYDLPTLRASNELVVNTPRPGFFSTPAFFANWPTNQSNQMRVTLNQTLIVATGSAIDGTDTTHPSSTPGLDAAHASTGAECYSCHQQLDPTRSILSSTYSWFYYSQSDPALMAQKGLFAFRGVITPVASIDDFATTLATHPAVSEAWAQKLCYWVNSAPCASADSEFQRIVGDFKRSNQSWSWLVRELLSSPIVTNATRTQTAADNGEVVAVTRRDHLCAALDNRFGLNDICGLDLFSKRMTTAVQQIVGGLPSDGYGRGSPIPVLPNQPTLFYRAGLENICASVSNLVIDNPAQRATGTKAWSSAQPAAAIADFVSTVMALTTSDARAQPATALLTAHFNDALKSGATSSDALKSTFVTACLAPSAIGIGM